MINLNLFWGLLLFIIGASLALSLWSVYEQQRFNRFEGSIRRGVQVRTEPLTWETRQFLENLPDSVRDERWFVRKEGSEVLIGEERGFWSSFWSRRNSLRYVGYINLSAPESMIELRAPLSSLVSSLFGLVTAIFVIWFFFNFFGLVSGDGFSLFSLFLWLFPLFILVTFAISMVVNHQLERRRLLGILNRAGRGQVKPEVYQTPQ